MNDKELNELLEYNQEYMDARLSEDVFGGDYTSEVELKYLQKDYDKLQSNWNSLREWLENLIDNFQEDVSTPILHEQMTIRLVYEYMGNLDKMNELESSDNNEG